MRDEKIRITCPHGHVIYNPVIEAGVGSRGQCVRSEADCTGTPRSLQRQVDTCHWKTRCELTVSSHSEITCGTGKDRCLRKITYIRFKHPYCIPKCKWSFPYMYTCRIINILLHRVK